MILRLILVGLVTSMGFELPSSRDVSSWVESSRAWAYHRTTDQTASGLPVVATEITTDYRATDADMAFHAAQGESLADFHAAEAMVSTTPSAVELASSTPAATDEVVAVDAASLSDGEEMAVANLLASEPAVAEPTAVAASQPEPAAHAADEVQAQAPVVVVEVTEVAVMVDSVDELDAAPTRGERLATALRLTREAAQAWASVIDEPAAAEATAAESTDAR